MRRYKVVLCLGTHTEEALPTEHNHPLAHVEALAWRLYEQGRPGDSLTIHCLPDEPDLPAAPTVHRDPLLGAEQEQEQEPAP